MSEMYDIRACINQRTAGQTAVVNGPRRSPRDVRTPRSPDNPSAVPSCNNKTSLHVGFLPVTTTNTQLSQKFLCYGEMRRCYVVPPKHGMSFTYGFVEFKSSLSAMTALRELHNTKWGESHITVQWERSTPASPREKQRVAGRLLELSEWTSTNPEVNQGSSQSPMVKCTRTNCQLAMRNTMKHNLAVAEAVVASFDSMTIPCMPVANPPNDRSAVDECSNDNPGATLKDSGYQSFVTTTGGSNSISSNSSTPVKRPPAEAMNEQRVHEAPWCVDSQPLSNHSAVSLGDQLQEECSVQVDPMPTVMNSVDDGPPPLKCTPLESLNSPLMSSSSGKNETESYPRNEVECTSSWPSYSPQCDKPTDPMQCATAPTSSGAGRGILSKQFQHGLRKPKPLVPIGRGRMLLKVLEESTRTCPAVGNVDVPIRTIMPAVSTASDRAHETAILKSMSKQANRSSKPKAVRIAAVFPGVDVKAQACNSSVPVRKDRPQDELVASEQDGLDDIPGIKAGGRHVLSAVNSDSLNSIQSQSSSSFTSSLQAGQNVRAGEHDISSSPPERSYQMLSSGDELEFRESRHGRSSDDLEKSIALHQRNIHRWQVELKRIQQKNVVASVEVEGEGGEEDQDRDVTLERVQEVDHVLQLHAQLATRTELLRRRDLDRELVLMKGHQQYMHDKLAQLELQLSLEAEEIREKLTLAKLENRTLQAKLEFFL